MNLSIAFRAQPPSFTFGISTACTDWNDHHLRSSSVILLVFGLVTVTALALEYGAPILIHSTRVLICSAGRVFFGGICRSSSICRTAFMSRLFSGSPGTTAGPVSPPLSNPSLESSTQLPLILSTSWLWHL